VSISAAQACHPVSITYRRQGHKTAAGLEIQSRGNSGLEEPTGHMCGTGRRTCVSTGWRPGCVWGHGAPWCQRRARSAAPPRARGPAGRPSAAPSAACLPAVARLTKAVSVKHGCPKAYCVASKTQKVERQKESAHCQNVRIQVKASEECERRRVVSLTGRGRKQGKGARWPGAHKVEGVDTSAALQQLLQQVRVAVARGNVDELHASKEQ
jgi:hypothetical protein